MWKAVCSALAKAEVRELDHRTLHKNVCGLDIAIVDAPSVTEICSKHKDIKIVGSMRAQATRKIDCPTGKLKCFGRKQLTYSSYYHLQWMSSLHK